MSKQCPSPALRTLAGAPALLFALGCTFEEAPAESAEVTRSSEQALIGAVSNSNTGAHVSASATVLSDAGACSGTLVAPDRVLIAQHCLCPAEPNLVVFANALGNTDNQPRYPVVDVKPHPWGPDLCEDIATQSDVSLSPFDIAVVQIGPGLQTGTLPPFTPVKVHLDLTHPSVGQGETWAVGYGFDANGNVGTRLSGQLTSVRSDTDPCDQLFELDCWNEPMWVAKSIGSGNSLEPQEGDSGGGLFFNVGTPFVRVAGAFSNSMPQSDTDRSRWAKTNLVGNAQFLWSAIGLPPTLSLDHQRTGTTIFAKTFVKVNDRAEVWEQDEIIGGRIVSQGEVMLGTDSFAGTIHTRTGNITLRERAHSSGALFTYLGGAVLGSGAVVDGLIYSGKFQVFEDFNLVDLPFASAGTSSSEVGNDVQTVLAPGAYPKMTFRARSSVTLNSGVYVFEALTVEPGAVVHALTSDGPVWIYIVGNERETRFQGALLGDASKVLVGIPDVFLGIPEVRTVVIGDSWRGTLVAPEARVIADMVSGATLRGSFFVDGFELHQGRFLYHAPFQGSWVPTCTSPSGFESCQ